MVRAPCCEKMGLKKGPWTQEEDRILINYINIHGHLNWRALPKLAGLLRCGKSCRLRWTNYLKPDIKRGNFSREEEETIIELHGALGNRWSAIAARLPGRTDNEIKNVWHTHLKKRVNPKPNAKTSELEPKVEETKQDQEEVMESSSLDTNSSSQTSYNQVDSPQPSSTDTSSVTTRTNENFCMDDDMVLDNFPEMDDQFWSEVFLGDNSDEFPVVHENIGQLPSGCVYESNLHDDMDFWFNVFTRGDELSQIQN